MTTAETEIDSTPILPGRRRQPWTRKKKLLALCAAGAFGLSLIFIPQFMGPAEKKEKEPDYAPHAAAAPFRMAKEPPKEEAWPEPNPDMGYHMPAVVNAAPSSTSGTGKAAMFAIKSVGSGVAATPTPTHPTKLSDDDDGADVAIGKGAKGNDGMIEATIVKDQKYVIPGDIEVGCTLLTAIDSQLRGPVRCQTAERVMSEDGSTELLPKGTRIRGMIASDMRRGQNRVGIVWTRMRTPEGVRVKINDPGADDLGRTGVPGQVDNHFLDRYGAALLFTALQAIPQIAQAALAQNNNGSSFTSLNFQGSQNVVGQILQETINIPPTILINQGVTLKIMIQEDIWFGNVYKLRMRYAR